MKKFLLMLLLPAIVVAEQTPFETTTYEDVLALNWEFKECSMWLGTKHNGECIWHQIENFQKVRQASCYMWDLFTNNQEMSCILQNLHPNYPVVPSDPVRVKFPFPGETILWNDALNLNGYQEASCGHQPRMQQCTVRGDTWFVVCRQFQAADQLKCRKIDIE